MFYLSQLGINQKSIKWGIITSKSELIVLAGATTLAYTVNYCNITVIYYRLTTVNLIKLTLQVIIYIDEITEF